MKEVLRTPLGLTFYSKTSQWIFKMRQETYSSLSFALSFCITLVVWPDNHHSSPNFFSFCFNFRTFLRPTSGINKTHKLLLLFFFKAVFTSGMYRRNQCVWSSVLFCVSHLWGSWSALAGGHWANAPGLVRSVTTCLRWQSVHGCLCNLVLLLSWSFNFF